MSKKSHDGALFYIPPETTSPFPLPSSEVMIPPVACRPDNSNVNIWQLLFLFKGRINRTTFWVYTVAVFSVTWVLYGNILNIPMFLPFFLCIPAWIRRLHDQNKTSAWLLCIGLPIGYYYYSWYEEIAILEKIAIISTLIGYLVIFVICGFLKGTAGSNEYYNYDRLRVKIFSMTIQSFLIFFIVVLDSYLGGIFSKTIAFLFKLPFTIPTAI